MHHASLVSYTADPQRAIYGSGDEVSLLSAIKHRLQYPFACAAERHNAALPINQLPGELLLQILHLDIDLPIRILPETTLEAEGLYVGLALLVTPSRLTVFGHRKERTKHFWKIKRLRSVSKIWARLVAESPSLWCTYRFLRRTRRNALCSCLGVPYSASTSGTGLPRQQNLYMRRHS